MLFSLIENALTFPFLGSAVQLPLSICCDKDFPVGFQADHVILLQLAEDEKHLIVIITAVHNKGGFSEKSSGLSDCIKRDRVYL